MEKQQRKRIPWDDTYVHLTEVLARGHLYYFVQDELQPEWIARHIIVNLHDIKICITHALADSCSKRVSLGRRPGTIIKYIYAALMRQIKLLSNPGKCMPRDATHIYAVRCRTRKSAREKILLLSTIFFLPRTTQTQSDRHDDDRHKSLEQEEYHLPIILCFSVAS